MPKKKKKSGGGKGGGRTAEEKLLRQQQKAEAEKQMLKKKEEALALFLKDKLQKEERNTQVNLLKLNEGWRTILRQTRAAELYDDATILCHTFERQLDSLDNILQTVACDAQEAEHQSDQVWRVHLQHLERLQALHKKQLTCLQQRWERSLQQISAKFMSEKELMLIHAQQQQVDLQDATFALEQQHNEVMTDTDRLYAECEAAKKNAHLQKMAALLAKEEEQLKKTSNQDAQKVGSEQSMMKLLLSGKLRLIEKTNAEMKRMIEFQNSLIELRAKLNSTEAEKASVAEGLMAATEEVHQKTPLLRDQLTQTRAAARKQLTDLTVQSTATAKNLQTVIAKGEKVLQIAEMCHKLEIEQETVTWSEGTDEDVLERSETHEPTKMPQLPMLMRRYNSALLRRESLRKQQEAVRQENQQLLLLLQQHLDAMTVSSVSDTALTVSPAPTSAATAATAATGRHHSVIEAVHAVKHTL